MLHVYSYSSLISVAAQRTVTVLVGEEDEQQAFQIHVELLSASSADFKEKIGKCDTREELKPLILNNVTVETFNTFTKWMYAQKSPTDGVEVEELHDDSGDGRKSSQRTKDGSDVEEPDGSRRERAGQQDRNVSGTSLSSDAQNKPDSDPGKSPETSKESVRWDARLNREGRVFGRLVDLWIFAARYDCVGFQQAVMIQLQRCVEDWEVVPCPTVVKRALDNLKLSAPLCQYLIRCYGYHADHEDMSKERLATLSSEFLVAVLDFTFLRINEDPPEMNDDWCEFHEHETESEREACSNGRQNDPDGGFKILRRSRPSFRGCC